MEANKLSTRKSMLACSRTFYCKFACSGEQEKFTNISVTLQELHKFPEVGFELALLVLGLHQGGGEQHHDQTDRARQPASGRTVHLAWLEKVVDSVYNLMIYIYMYVYHF